MLANGLFEIFQSGLCSLTVIVIVFDKSMEPLCVCGFSYMISTTYTTLLLYSLLLQLVSQSLSL